MAEHIYSEIVASLTAAFTSPGALELPRGERTPVTAALEAALDKLIALLKPDLFLEVGAFEAEFSRRMKAAYPEVRAMALEANPRVYASFANKLAATGVEYLHLAADARSGVVRFFIPEIVGGHPKPRVSRMGSLNEIGAPNSEMTEVQVNGVSLDELTVPTQAQRVCMWIDVEGAVDKVLSGAALTLSNTIIAYCEVENRPIWKSGASADEIIGQMARAGFFMAARDFQTNSQYNALFLRNDLMSIAPLLTLLQEYAGQATEIVTSLISTRESARQSAGARS